MIIQNSKFKIQNYNSKVKTFILLTFTFAFCLLTFNFVPTFAQTQSCGGTGTARATGLVSTPQFQSGSKFGTTGACIIDPKAAFVPFKIPIFDELKSLYYDQSKAAKSTITTLPASFSGDRVYKVTGDLTVSTSPTGSDTQVIFVDGNLNITANYTYGTASTGTLFVVKGNVNIDSAVTRVDATIIAEGKIYTAGTGCSQASPVTTSQLVINGSLISLSEGSKIEFCRTLSDNSQPSERIVHQPKYLVILRNLVADTLQKWSEITGEGLIPTSTLTPTPTPSPTPTPTPSCTNGYKDNDQDGYGAGAFGCYAQSTSYNIVSNNTDCYDSNANAKPGQTSYFTTNRGDGSFDYDCSGGTEMRSTNDTSAVVTDKGCASTVGCTGTSYKNSSCNTAVSPHTCYYQPGCTAVVSAGDCGTAPGLFARIYMIDVESVCNPNETTNRWSVGGTLECR